LTFGPATAFYSASIDGNEITVDGRDYLILREDEVLAVLEDVKISKKAA
jgi:co-chaperonin GroES (HSP10)